MQALAPYLALVVGLGAGPALGCSSDGPSTASASLLSPADTPTVAASHGVNIVGLPATPRVSTGRTDALGRPVTLACGDCHAVKAADPTVRDGAALDRFHQGLTMAHGGLTCLSCHDGGDYDRLHLVDGTRIGFPQVMTLCRQCHGTQMRDYAHGAHGGMQGYWDRRRGPRTKNACTVCHDPHAPAYLGVMPARGPAAPLDRPAGAHDD